ncbi:MAG: CvpA family protein [Thermoguttaceae bacterium]|jgi:hypothetical protein
MKNWLSNWLFPTALLLILSGCGSYTAGTSGGAAEAGYGGWILSALLLVIFAACVAFLYPESLWSNALRLVNVVTAGLLAMNFFEPAARWLTGQMPSYTALWDFLALWAVFVLSFIVLRTITDRISRVDVRFLKLADRIGSGLLAAWIGWVMVGFSLTTLHTAPLVKNFLFGGFQPGEKMFFGLLAPDLEWLAFTQKVSRGAYSRSGEAEAPDAYVFYSEFPAKQAERRKNLAAYLDQTGALRVDPNAPPGPPLPRAP